MDRRTIPRSAGPGAGTGTGTAGGPARGGPDVALLFPGQGSQYAGMGARLPAGGPGRDALREADDALGLGLSRLMREGPPGELTRTDNAQPAILAHSLALLAEARPVLEARGARVALVLGHSVGEYAALAAAGSLSAGDAVLAVRRRGEYMREALPPGAEGAMHAVLGVPGDAVARACREEGGGGGRAVPANFNAPGQTVVSGEARACERALSWLRANHPGPVRSVRLDVSAPFHSPLMRGAADRLRRHLDTVDIGPNRIPYVANVDAREYPAGTPGGTIRENLHRQAHRSVLWSRSCLAVPPGALAVECGPGRVLCGLMGRIRPGARSLPLDGDGALEALDRELGRGPEQPADRPAEEEGA